jgi:DNA helicase II / ATP-dependent DNA helicase PcrA
MSVHPAVRERLDRLAPDQRAAATAPPGPVLCVAPAGSGKTTTLVARIAWLVGEGTNPDSICAVTFNRRAAEELRGRLDTALAPLDLPAGSVRVRTFHALGREILLDAGARVEPLLDRAEVLGEVLGTGAGSPRLRLFDDAFSRLKLDRGVDTATAGRLAAALPSPPAAAAEGAPDPLSSDPAILRAFVRYEAALAERGGLDHDDLLVRALRALETDDALLGRWRRHCSELLVDEVQDVDRSQLRLALLLAAPENRVFLVGDDDQTIYAWRLADVRRVLGLAAALPGLRRTDLVVNYRCPAAVVERAVRLVERNRERFAKSISARPSAGGSLYLLPDPGDDVARARRLLRNWPVDGASRAVLARTNAELAPYAAVALELDIPYRAADDGLALDPTTIGSEEILASLSGSATSDPAAASARESVARLALLATASGVDDAPLAEGARMLLPWAPAAPGPGALASLVRAAREHRAALRRDDAALVLATIHGTKGLEFDHVAVVNLDAGRFPNARSLAEAPDPDRELEEERRLAYVAWTRARQSLVLIYDPGAPSPFLRDAFTDDELAGPPALSDVQRQRTSTEKST